ncbi:E3 ubiquitin-protein ligase TRIM32 isoform X4 [Entelurus aequoreus]|uniref:E3 ubiquitin-protein ligase TRIM32 isoform X4 n=1 Tax=Entelurus aequoreus TaxID=161455 RepID=UPI002B1DA68E|nr:E3 ubiquitin-protein ligase TRIM32 isoform X4 [Entelurus aequoreus]
MTELTDWSFACRACVRQFKRPAQTLTKPPPYDVKPEASLYPLLTVTGGALVVETETKLSGPPPTPVTNEGGAHTASLRLNPPPKLMLSPECKSPLVPKPQNNSHPAENLPNMPNLTRQQIMHESTQNSSLYTPDHFVAINKCPPPVDDSLSRAHQTFLNNTQQSQTLWSPVTVNGSMEGYIDQHPHEPHAYNIRSKKLEGHAYPLFPDNSGRFQYKPFAVADMQAIVDKLPPVSEGGSLWLNTLDKLTAGYTLSVEDFRSILYRCVSTQDGKNTEQQVGLMAESSTSPITPYVTNIATAMRSLFPQDEDDKANDRAARKQLLNLQIAENKRLKEPKGQRSARIYSAVGDLAFEFQQVEERILNRRGTRRLDSGGGQHGASKSVRGRNCFACDQPGHWARECPNISEQERSRFAGKRTLYRRGKGRPPQEPQQEIQTGPLLDMSVNGQCYQFVIDTGATHSILNAEVPKKLCASSLKVKGFAGVTRRLPVTKPLPVQIAGHTLKHPFVIDLHTPCQIGNDLLYRLYPDIQYRTEGTFLVLPDGSTTQLRHHYQGSSMSSYHSLKQQEWLTSNCSNSENPD